jgi:hypothetical protein
LKEKYKIKELGEATWFLGIKISDSAEGIKMDQETYARSVLHRFNMSECASAKYPEESTPLTKTKDGDELSAAPYREAVGALMYLTITRPDISHAVGQAARYCSEPARKHWTAVKQILRYIKGTVGKGIKFQRGNRAELTGYADANWAGCPDTRRSVTGYVFKFAGGPITWQSKVQKTCALSSTEGEYMALAAACQEVKWLRQLLTELGFGPTGETIIYEDNQACIKLSENPHAHGRTKHIDVRHHFIRELIAQGEVKIEYVPSKSNIADIFTKGVTGKLYSLLTQKAGVI